MIERGCDDSSNGAVGSADIEKFYDSLPMLSICKFLVCKGLSLTLLSACLAFQMFPKVSLSLMGQEAVICNRSLGGLTGSRVAGCFGRAVGLDLISSCFRAWAPLSLSLDDHSVLSVGLWIDNIFSFAPNPRNAVSILEIAEN